MVVCLDTLLSTQYFAEFFVHAFEFLLYICTRRRKGQKYARKRATTTRWVLTALLRTRGVLGEHNTDFIRHRKLGRTVSHDGLEFTGRWRRWDWPRSQNRHPGRSASTCLSFSPPFTAMADEFLELPQASVMRIVKASVRHWWVTGAHFCPFFSLSRGTW